MPVRNPAPTDGLFRRRRFERPHRRPSTLAQVARPFGHALLTVGVPAALAFWLMTSPRFQLRRVDVEGGRRVSAAWVVAAVGSLRGRPLLLVSLDEVERQLGRHPWVAGAGIRKDLPDRLEIRIHERVPAAVVVAPDGTTWVDGQGRSIEPCPATATPDLLRITGAVGDAGAVAGALRVADRLRDSSAPWAASLTEAEILGPDDFRIHSSALPFTLLVSGARIGDALEPFQHYLPQLLERHDGIAAVDLRFARQIVVHFPEV
ncbi:MAG: FtsQ-type POTRA domain-containing protein [Thermoanaerobaculia bacterium]